MLGFAGGAGGKGSERGSLGDRVGALDPDQVALGLLRVESHHDFFGARREEVQADVVRREGKPPAAAIDEDGQLDLGRAPVIEQLVERGLDGAAGEKDVVNQDDGRAMHVARDLRGRKLLWNRMAPDVVAVKGDVDCADAGRNIAVECFERSVQAPGELDAAVGDAKEEKGFSSAMTFGNGFGEPLDGGLYFFGADGLVFGHEARLWRSDEAR